MKRFWEEGKTGPAQDGAKGAGAPAPQASGAPGASASGRVVSAAPAVVPVDAASRRVEPIAAAAPPAHAPTTMAAVVPTVAAPTAPAGPARSVSALAGFFSGEAVSSAAEVPAKAPSLRIGALALCSKVEGFGKVVRMESARITGKPVPLLIYTQVEGFAYRTVGGSATGADDSRTQWVVDLGQTVVVYRLGADGKEPDEQVLYVPEQPSRDVSMGKRRDHYLVQRIELSPWLVAGKYAVKVTVRDKATGVVDERVSEIVLR